ncbi:MAG: hypothetical protein HY689_16135 [Chloroflexi bacterium]|nr:hypothetical protein [Chloroflexota bacterium]
MMHEYYEISISTLIAMSKDEFLERCSRYLEDALADERRRDIDRQAREYARKYLGFDPGSDLTSQFGL